MSRKSPETAAMDSKIDVDLADVIRKSPETASRDSKIDVDLADVKLINIF